MPSVRSVPQQIGADPPNHYILGNIGGDTLYLGGPNVSPTLFTATLTVGNSATLTLTTWLVSGSETDYTLTAVLPSAASSVGGASHGIGAPSTLAEGLTYFQTDAGGIVVAEWIGTTGPPLKVAVLQGNQYGRLTDQPAAPSVPDGAWYTATDQTPKQVFQAVSNAWVRIV